MKHYYLIIFFFIFACSFDNKTGIWEDENSIKEIKKKDDTFKGFKNLNSNKEVFNEIINPKKNFQFFSEPKILNEWNDEFDYEKIINNFSFKEKNVKVYKGKKLSRSPLSKSLLYKNGNIFASDQKGNLIIYSVENNSILQKFNFYKKKYKSLKKIINILIEGNTIFISDNIGYIYAYNYLEKKILWAKRNSVPFRSNLKIFNNYLISADQNNNLIFFNKKNGEQIKKIPTEISKYNGKFVNYVNYKNENIYFLNTFGSLYSISKDLNINWFLNLNKAVETNANNIFYSNNVLVNNNEIYVLTNDQFYIINGENGLILYKNNFSSKLSPVIYENYIFLLNENNFLILMDRKNKEIIYSLDLNNRLKENILKKRFKFDPLKFKIVNNNLFIFLKDSNLLKLELSGNLKEIVDINSKINSNILFINNSIFFLNSRKKLIILD
tara:strand:+ start:3885 stop:5204 length:1320 start_codon:yes stop_codon:yes gene_type:complete